jgi:hypothetical protein
MLAAILDLAGQRLGAIPLDSIAFIALIVIAVFLRWIAQQAEKAKKKSEQQGTQRSSTPPTPVREETDEDRVRRFLEALGQPASAKPPSKVTARPIQKRRVVPPRRPILSPLPPLTTVPSDLPPQTPASSEPPIIPYGASPRVVEAEVAQAAVFEARGITAARAETASRKKNLPVVSDLFPETATGSLVYPELLVLLRSPRGLRDAIILREVFGPPRSLQALSEN